MHKLNITHKTSCLLNYMFFIQQFQHIQNFFMRFSNKQKTFYLHDFMRYSNEHGIKYQFMSDFQQLVTLVYIMVWLGSQYVNFCAYLTKVKCESETICMQNLQNFSVFDVYEHNMIRQSCCLVCHKNRPTVRQTNKLFHKIYMRKQTHKVHRLFAHCVNTG